MIDRYSAKETNYSSYVSKQQSIHYVNEAKQGIVVCVFEYSIPDTGLRLSLGHITVAPRHHTVPQPLTQEQNGGVQSVELRKKDREDIA